LSSLVPAHHLLCISSSRSARLSMRENFAAPPPALPFQYLQFQRSNPWCFHQGPQRQSRLGEPPILERGAVGSKRYMCTLRLVSSTKDREEDLGERPFRLGVETAGFLGPGGGLRWLRAVGGAAYRRYSGAPSSAFAKLFSASCRETSKTWPMPPKTLDFLPEKIDRRRLHRHS